MTEKLVAFQGEHGANSEAAILKYFGEDTPTLPCHEFRDIFEAIREGNATHGMLPVENALAGTVAQSYELLMEYDFRVVGEIILPIIYQVMAPQGVSIDDIKTVKSHPQALAQCEHYIRRRGWQPHVTYDTAGAAMELAQNPEPHMAAIAAPLAAQHYDLSVLDNHVEDDPENSTRFFVLGTEDAARKDPSKTSLVFGVRHHPGSLYQCIGCFAERGINLTKLESRSMRGRLWTYMFYVDFEGHSHDDMASEALVDLLRKAAFVKMLGSYPAAIGGPNSNNGA
jgi:prephenate dehydratase